jgi:hypothetical protein
MQSGPTWDLSWLLVCARSGAVIRFQRLLVGEKKTGRAAMRGRKKGLLFGCCCLIGPFLEQLPCHSTTASCNLATGESSHQGAEPMQTA